jgi:Fur family transcriptional regulator, ferric uptake regulator
MNILESTKTKLEINGLKQTNQRSLILNIVKEGHRDAHEIYRLAAEKQPRISLSTVYRTIRRLKEMGLLAELHFDEAHHHYELKHSPETCHLVCHECGRIIEFDYKLSQSIKKKIEGQKSFRVTGVEMEITGLCAACQKKQAKSGNSLLA